MMTTTLSNDCLELFGTKDLFQILRLDNDGGLTDAKVKKAYYQQSVLWHPDRFTSAQYSDEDKQLATRKFQIIGKAYQVLGDKEKRVLYEQTGFLGEDDDFAGTTDWITVWRGLFKKVTKEDIDEYLRKFRGSEQEMEDVKKAYVKYKGDMNKLLSTVIGADVHNEDRIREIIRHYIERGEVEAYPKFVHEPPSARVKRLKKAKREETEAEQVLKEMQGQEAAGGSGTSGDLASLVMAKQEKRAKQQVDFLAQLEQKYCSKEEPKTNKKTRSGK